MGGWFSGNKFPTLDAEFKFAKIQNPHVRGGGGGVVETNFQLLMPSSNLLKSKIPMFRGGGRGLAGGPMFRGGGLVETNFQLLMLSSNLLKSKNPIFRMGGGVFSENQFPLMPLFSTSDVPHLVHVKCHV